MVLKVVAKVFWQYQKEHPLYVLFNIIFISATITNNFYLPSIYGNVLNYYSN